MHISYITTEYPRPNLPPAEGIGSFVKTMADSLVTQGVIFPKNSSYFSFFQFSSLDVLMIFTMWHELCGFKHVDGAYWSLLPELLFYLLMSFLFVVKSINRYYLYNSALLLLCCGHYFSPFPLVGKILNLHYILLFMIGIAFYRLHTNRANFFEHIFIFLNLSIGVLLYNVAQPSVSVKLLFFLFFCCNYFVLFIYLWETKISYCSKTFDFFRKYIICFVFSTSKYRLRCYLSIRRYYRSFFLNDNCDSHCNYSSLYHYL